MTKADIISFLGVPGPMQSNICQGVDAHLRVSLARPQTISAALAKITSIRLHGCTVASLRIMSQRADVTYQQATIRFQSKFSLLIEILI